jgi:putative addiction module killer protein
MYEIQKAGQFSRWLNKLKDNKAKHQIVLRIRQLNLGRFGDHKYLGNKISELRVHVGQGYRIYYSVEDDKIIILLCGGSKSSQKRDFKLSQKILKAWK